jgi:hypothetical protein
LHLVGYTLEYEYNFFTSNPSLLLHSSSPSVYQTLKTNFGNTPPLLPPPVNCCWQLLPGR